jgi:hypothetical protein
VGDKGEKTFTLLVFTYINPPLIKSEFILLKGCRIRRDLRGSGRPGEGLGFVDREPAGSCSGICHSGETPNRNPGGAKPQ